MFLLGNLFFWYLPLNPVSSLLFVLSLLLCRCVTFQASLYRRPSCRFQFVQMVWLAFSSLMLQSFVKLLLKGIFKVTPSNTVLGRLLLKKKKNAVCFEAGVFFSLCYLSPIWHFLLAFMGFVFVPVRDATVLTQLFILIILNTLKRAAPAR